MYEVVEEEYVEEPEEPDVIELQVAPFAESGAYLYVCEECGNPLTEIPYYNRYYCENCGLHY